MKKALFGVATFGLLIGCGYPMGLLYTGTTTPHPVSKTEQSGQGKTGDKSGEACASGILGLVAWGDASTDAAKKAGGITDVHTEEFGMMSILGIYQQGCTVVSGK